MMDLHVPLQQVLNCEGIGTGRDGTSIGACAQPRAAEQGAAGAPRAAVAGPHVRHPVGLGAQCSSAASTPSTNPYFAFTTVSDGKVNLRNLNPFKFY